MSKKQIKDEIQIAPIQSEEGDLDAPLQPYEILSYPADFTLEVLVDKWGKKEINVPPLQRRYIWPLERASKLIESFLLGLPVPPIFVYKDRDEKLLIVDGHQRLRSIVYFFSGWFGEQDDPEREPFKLTGLHEKSPFGGADFQQLKNNDPKSFNRLNNSVLRAFIMKQIHPNDDTSILAVFERLNTGGVTLQGQEIRNCIYEGKFNESLKELNKDSNWRKIVGTQTGDKRMRDVELILRFLALYHNSKHYEKPMKSFLNDFMAANRRAADGRQREFDGRIATFENLFRRTAKAVLVHLSSKPFHIARGLNAAVFDSVFTAFARNLDKLTDDPRAAEVKQIETKYLALLDNKNYMKLVSAATTDKDVVAKRLKRAENMLFS